MCASKLVLSTERKWERQWFVQIKETPVQENYSFLLPSSAAVLALLSALIIPISWADSW